MMTKLLALVMAVFVLFLVMSCVVKQESQQSTPMNLPIKIDPESSPAAPPPPVQQAEVKWLNQFGAESKDCASSVATDTQENAYVVGYIASGALPGQRPIGAWDSFIRKYSSAGKVEWTSQFGGIGSDEARAVTVDRFGGVYVVGCTNTEFGGQKDFGNNDVYICKFSDAGKIDWQRIFGTTGNDFPYGVAVDDSQNIYIAGTTDSTFAGQQSAGKTDGFIRKLNRSGTEQWTRQFGGAKNDYTYDIALDGSGNVFVVGYTEGSIGSQANSGYSDVIVLKYSPTGDILWQKQFGTTSSDEAYSIAVTSTGNLFVAGYTGGNFTGSPAFHLREAFVMKLNSSGNMMWTRQFEGDPEAFLYSVATDGEDCYIAGHTIGYLEGQQPHSILNTLTHTFVRKYSSTGNEIWIFQFSDSCEETHDIALDKHGNAYVVGLELQSLSGQTSFGNGDAFIAKVGPKVTLVPRQTRTLK